jgi:hypothetical protein
LTAGCSMYNSQRSISIEASYIEQPYQENK